MISMGVVCFLCAFFFAFPWWLQSFMFELITFGAFAFAVALAIYGKESKQAFGIGACLALAIRFIRSDLWAQGYGINVARIFANSIALAATVAVAGFACVFARKWVISTSGAGSPVASVSTTASPPMAKPPNVSVDEQPAPKRAESASMKAPPIQKNPD